MTELFCEMLGIKNVDCLKRGFAAVLSAFIQIDVWVKLSCSELENRWPLNSVLNPC